MNDSPPLPPPAKPFTDDQLLTQAELRSARWWRMGLLAMAVAMTWLAPVLPVAASRSLANVHDWPRYILYLFLGNLAALGAMMAAWTIGGPRNFAVRLVTALGLGMFLVRQTCWAFVYVSDAPNEWEKFLFTETGVAFFATWLAISFLASLIVMGICYACGWRLLPSASESSSQFHLLDLCILVASVALGAWTVAEALKTPLESGLFAGWYYGVVFAAIGFVFAGVPILIVSTTALYCARHALSTIRGGAIGSLGLVLAIAVLKRFFDWNSLDMASFFLGGVLEYLFVLLSTAFLQACWDDDGGLESADLFGGNKNASPGRMD